MPKGLAFQFYRSGREAGKAVADGHARMVLRICRVAWAEIDAMPGPQRSACDAAFNKGYAEGKRGGK